MTTVAQSQHVYVRSIDGQNDSLSLVASAIEPGHVVLDLGMGAGALARFVRADRDAIFDGVTFNPLEAEIAAPDYRTVVVADLEDPQWQDALQGRLYDRIVCADVLEHLRHPERVLEQCRNLLAPGGRLVTSVPNIGHCGLLAELLHGDFRYRQEGLLDNTHLRFFTRKSLQRFLMENGWQVESAAVTTRDLNSTEFKPYIDVLPPAVARFLLTLPDALTYQFVDVLVPAEPQALPVFPAQAPALSAQALFTSAVYYAVDGHWSETQKQELPAQMGLEKLALRFDLPAISHGSYSALRLDLADRPGWMRLYSVRVHVEGEAWVWDLGRNGLGELERTPHHQLFLGAPWPVADCAWLLLLGDDPWLHLPVGPPWLDRLSHAGGTLEVVLSAPMSADFLSAIEAVDRLRVRYDQELAENARRLQDQKQQLALQDNEKSELLERLFQAQEEAARMTHYVQSLEATKWFRYGRWLSQKRAALRTRLRGRAAPGSLASVTRQDARLQHAPQPRPEAPVDVVVPVYKGLEDTQRCLQSVLASRCQTPWHLVVINDCSPEPEVTAWLRELATKEASITLIENEVNLGFVGTVNKAMRLHPQRDVVLLNSDTEVANDWLDRIQRGAYSQARVATVTPFSNNATICSYPSFCKPSDLPAGWDTASLDQLCAQHLDRQAVQVPTGVGFCMYIRRACLDEVGLFDEEHFGKGYGEENDFCVRASQAGWKNLHLLDTFVRHAGGVSFGESKSERELAALQTLRRLHPHYEAEVHALVEQDPARHARALLDVARIVQGGRALVLNVLHNRSGGTPRHVQELAVAMADQLTYLTLIPRDGGLVLRLQGAHEAFAVHWRGRVEDIWQQVVGTLRRLGVAHVHYHHLLDHHPRMLTIHEALGVSHDFTVHDFYAYCPQISLTDEQDRYCGEQGLAQCRTCVRQRPAPGNVDIEVWRGRYLSLLNKARWVICPSVDALARMKKFAPQARLVLASHTQLEQKTLETAPVLKLWPKDTNRPLKVVVLGGMSRIKGADTLEAVATLAAVQKAPVEFHLLGFGYRALRTLPRAKLTVHGSYEEHDLADLLEALDADMAWFPAQWPETFSYTLSACLNARLPVMAVNLGALAERLHLRPWTWVMDWRSTPQQWLDHLLQARESLAQGQMPPLPQTLVQDGWWEEISYREQYLRTLKPAVVNESPAELLSGLPLLKQGQGAMAEGQSATLKLLYGLRNLPLLSAVSRFIPSHVQRRVKSLLVR